MQEILSKIIIGERIKNLRLESNLSQSFIAEILNISRSNYSQIELGNQFPSFNTLYLIARYYSKSYEWILHGEIDNSLDDPLTEVDSMIKSLETLLTDFKKSVEDLEQELIQIKTKTLRYTITNKN